MSDWQGQQPPNMGGAGSGGAGAPGGPGGPPGGGAPGGQMPGGQWSAPELAAQAGVVRVGDVLQTGARIVGGNLGAFFVVSFCATLPGLGISQYFTIQFQERMFAWQTDLLRMTQGGQLGGMPDFRELVDPGLFGGMCFGWFVQFILVYMAQAILMFAVVETMAGRKPAMGAAISKGMSRTPAVLATALLMTLAMTAAMMPGMLAGVLVMAGAAAGDAPLAASCCGLPTMCILAFVPWIYLIVVFFLAVPTAVVEKVGPIQALSRSLSLTKGNRVTIFLVLLCVVLVIMVFGCVGGMFGAIAGGGGVDMTTGLPEAPSTASYVVSTIMAIIISSVQTMLLSSFAGVTYARIRGIRDGVDANALAEVFS